jgi:hypothetical protein
MGVTNFSGLQVAGIPTQGIAGAPLFTGTWFFVDAVYGSDGNSGAADQPLQTVYRAYSKMTSGKNDVIVIVGSGSTAGTQRMSVANAAATDSTATTGTITWAKNACHMIGMTAPTVNGRARFAPPTGTYTAATFGNSGNMFNVTAQGCFFANFSVYNGFSTGATGQICWIDAGGRNYYNNVSFLGMNDAVSSADTGSRSLKISGTVGENTFVNCEIGGDTTTRSAANASLEFAGGTPRNFFMGCNFPFQGSAAGVLGIVGTGAACMDRFQKFDRCTFINNIKSTSTTMSALTSLTSASPGGMIVMKDCTLVGITEFGDTNGLANTYVDGASVVAATSGIAVNPS